MTEFRYGDEKTIHRTGVVNVEVDPDGVVVAVWFRCMPLPFDAHGASWERAKEMTRMYDSMSRDRAPSVTAVVFKEQP